MSGKGRGKGGLSVHRHDEAISQVNALNGNCLYTQFTDRKQ